LKARRSKFGTGGRGSRNSAGGSSRAGGGEGSSGGVASSEGVSARSAGARGPHPSRSSSGPRVSRGPGARASGKGKTRGSSQSRDSSSSKDGKGRPSVGGASAHVGSIVEGVVSANRAGYGFLRVDGMKDSVFIPPKEMNGVMHGDRLKVKLAQDSSDPGSAPSSRSSPAASKNS